MRLIDTSAYVSEIIIIWITSLFSVFQNKRELVIWKLNNSVMGFQVAEYWDRKRTQDDTMGTFSGEHIWDLKKLSVQIDADTVMLLPSWADLHRMFHHRAVHTTLHTLGFPPGVLLNRNVPKRPCWVRTCVWWKVRSAWRFQSLHKKESYRRYCGIPISWPVSSHKNTWIL